MNTVKIDNPMKEWKSCRVGMDPNFGNGSPLKLMRKAFVSIVSGTELEIWFQGRAIYERRFGNDTIPREILVEVREVNPYPNCNFWVDDRFLLSGNGIEYAQELEVRTSAPLVRVIENTFMDK
jgi:hypothetical protein